MERIFSLRVFFRSLFSIFSLSVVLVLQAHGQQQPLARAFPTRDPIYLDGRLNEISWQSATPIGRLIQSDPKEGEAPTEETEVRVLVDAQALYFGINCHDRTPSVIVATQLTRDANLRVDDSVLVILDPFFDRRNGFFFEVNPAAARADGQVGNNSEHRSYEWDGIWNAAAQITDEGWIAELAIPFKTLRYKPGQKVWGLNIERHIKRRNETARWAGARRDIWISNLAEAGRLEGLTSVRQGRGLDVRPFFSAGSEDGDGKADFGIDVSKNLTPNLNASFTVNTDFAETEVDARQVNLTRFPLFYPEKRTFFLEGAGVFELGDLSGSGADIIPFFSRLIGLLSDLDRTVPILGGMKVIGRLPNYNVGFLDVQTRRVDDLKLAGQNLLAARVSRNFFRQSSIGAIFTRGNPKGTGDNSLIGADARFATSRFRGGKNLVLDLYLLRTDDGESGKTDYAGGFRVDYPNDLWDWSMSWRQIGDHFIPALGFVPRKGIRKSLGALRLNPRPERYGIRQLTFMVRPELITNLQNNVENWSVRVTPISIRMESDDRIWFNITPQFERLEEPFEIFAGVMLPAGSYQWMQYHAQIETATKRRWVVGFSAGWGSFYDGTRRELEASVTLKPNTHLAVDLRAVRNDVSLSAGRFFTQILTAQADYNFSPNVSWTNLVQYDNVSRVLGLQSRFRWILKPGNDLFLVMNRGWIKDFDGSYRSNFDKATVKLQYTFRF